MNLQFAWPWLLAAAALPLLSALLLPRARPAPGRGLRVPFLGVLQDAGLVGRQAGPLARRRALALAAWLLLVLAAARPQWLGETVELPITARSLMLAVDISGSMGQGDMQLNGAPASRLAAVKAVADDFLRRRVGDRVGLILFGTSAYVQAPLTLDRKTVGILLDEAQVGLAGNSTALGDAIGLAVKRLREQPEENRVLILLTDGANTAGEVEPLKAADLAAQEQVRIYTIGVGGEEILVRTPFGVRRLVGGDLDTATLQAIADKTGGRFFRARDTAALAEVYAELDAMEPISDDLLRYRPATELYAWPLGAALLLTLLPALPFAGARPRVPAAAESERA